MQFEFTPAAERALVAAASWGRPAEPDELEAPEVLLGLLAEPECRAALLLARHGIDAAAVGRAFGELAVLQPPRPQRATRFSVGLLAALEAAERLLFEHPRPLSLATEHLLLGIVAAPSATSRWLNDRGLHAEVLEAEVHRLAGHQAGPLPIAPIDMPEEELADPMASEVAPRDAPSRQVPAHDQLAALRIIDAAANRAGEGLRVIEDYLRLALDDQHLTRVCKAIRHELAEQLAAVLPAERHAARETQADVGTRITHEGEQIRDDLAAVVEANFKRVEQSVRSLEEFSKLGAPETAAALEQLRYRVYTLERVVDIARTSRERLAEARLYVLVDGCGSIEAFDPLVKALVSAGVAMIQLRDKTLDDRKLIERARRLRELTRSTKTLFIVNDRPDLALLSAADGVHVGQEELSVKDARRIIGAGGLVGVSTHSIEQARAAVLDGANYIGVGPTFRSGTKQFSEFTGVELLRAVHAEIRLPAFAIGGITPENLPQVKTAGFTRIAVGGAITSADNPAAAARQLLAAMARQCAL